MADPAVLLLHVSAQRRQRVGQQSLRRLAAFRRRSARRKVLLVLMLCTFLMDMMTARMPRSVWSFPRASTWWENIVNGSFTSRDWLENFRVSHETFNYLCDQLQPSIARKTTRLRRPVSVQQRVAITLWILATSCEYRTVAHLFGLARCTICCIVKDTCKSIVKVLLPKYISFPTGNRLNETVRGFKAKWGIPECVGSIDGSHIPIRPPAMNHTDYYNRKGFYSMILQGVVDHNCLFTDLCIGWAGCVHDARVLVNSSIYQKCNNGELLDGQTLSFNSTQIPNFLVGDSAYPLLPWLIKPFAQSPSLSASEKLYNYRMCRGRVVVEIAFGRLKARWRRLTKQNEMSIRNVPNVIAACCTLHNVCEIHGDLFNEEWLEEINSETDDLTGAQPSTSSQDDAEDIRNALVQYFVQNPL